jgi:hypothetical protein
MTFKDDGVTLALGNTKGEVVLIDLKRPNQALQRLQGHGPLPVVSVQFCAARQLRRRSEHRTSSINSSKKIAEDEPSENLDPATAPIGADKAPRVKFARVPGSKKTNSKSPTRNSMSGSIPFRSHSPKFPLETHMRKGGIVLDPAGRAREQVNIKTGQIPKDNTFRTNEAQDGPLSMGSNAMNPLEKPSPNEPSKVLENTSPKSMNSAKRDEEAISNPPSSPTAPLRSKMFDLNVFSPVNSGINVALAAEPESPLASSNQGTRCEPSQPMKIQVPSSPDHRNQQSTQNARPVALTSRSLSPRRPQSPGVTASIPVFVPSITTVAPSSPIRATSPQRGAPGHVYGATLTSYPVAVGTSAAFSTQFIENAVENSLASFRDSIRNNIQNVHLEIIRQFDMQRNDMECMIQQMVGVKEILEENRRLKADLAKFLGHYG